MDVRARDMIRRRAGLRCEYCHTPDQPAEFSFHVEHIVAVVHEPNHHETNLAWACPQCNAHKGLNLTTIDPTTGQKVDIFNPRTDVWEDHFEIEEYVIVGLTSVGRGTTRLLQMNAPIRIAVREEIM